MLVLFVEDERDLAELTIEFLELEDIECDYADDGQMALNLLSSNVYDVIVLDVNIPKMDGFTLCDKLKSKGDHTPVIFLTARDALNDKLTGFSLGAEDYLTKPFELPELSARIKVLAQRNKPKSTTFELDTLYVNIQQRKIYRSNKEVLLTHTQWLLLAALINHSPNVVDRITLENAIWPDQIPSKDMLKTLVFRVRTLIDLPQEQSLIHTIRGTGIVLRKNANGT